MGTDTHTIDGKFVQVYIGTWETTGGRGEG